jgi:hypothetical protein
MEVLFTIPPSEFKKYLNTDQKVPQNRESGSEEREAYAYGMVRFSLAVFVCSPEC